MGGATRQEVVGSSLQRNTNADICSRGHGHASKRTICLREVQYLAHALTHRSGGSAGAHAGIIIQRPGRVAHIRSQLALEPSFLITLAPKDVPPEMCWSNIGPVSLAWFPSFKDLNFVVSV